MSNKMQQEKSLLNINLNAKRGEDESYSDYKIRLVQNKKLLKIYRLSGREQFKKMFPEGVDYTMFNAQPENQENNEQG
tara:strand:- start:4895 stop:5128 length:234 start_codon:yes stop_codon:yes gene_type:complete